MAPQIVIQPASKSSNDDEASLKYKRFGWRKFRIDGFLSRPILAYMTLCACNFIQNFTVNGANNAVISTLERVFYLDSVQSGLFLCLYDLATVFSSPLVGYLGSRYSSPIFFSLNMIIVGMGNMLIASSNFVNRDPLYYFTPELAQYLSGYNNVLFQCEKDPLNEFNITDVTCLQQEHLSSASRNAKFILYLGNFVNGIGSVALFTIGIAYIERIFPRERAAYCQGIYFAVGTVGGALGIVVTGRFLLIFTKLTPRRRLPSWLTPGHPLWIGCWWLPYFLYGGLCLLIGLFVSGLPNFEKPGKKHHIGTTAPTSTTQNDQNPTNPSFVREDSQTTISMLSSCPPTYAIQKNSSNSPSDGKDQIENVLPSLQPLSDEYHLYNRKPRQLSPIQTKPSMNTSSLTVDDTTKGFVNQAYSSEAPVNQLANNNSNLSVPSLQSSTPDSKVSPASTVSSSPVILTETALESAKHMFSVIKELLRNARYVFIVIACLFEGVLIKGFVPFITKYFEYQHQLDTSTATLITGAIALLSVIIGCPMGAYFMNRFSWTPMRCARVCGIVFTVSAFLFLFLTLSCPELKFEYSSCTKSNQICCHNIYHPVCTVSGPRRMFLSPCHFGCTNQTTLASNGTTLYSSCNCVADPTVTLSEVACRFRQIPCVIIFALAMTGATLVVFFTAFIQVPMLHVLLYSVPLAHQSMALGVRQTIVRVFGQTSGPLLFGFVFDQSCLVWLTDCYARRTCKVYDNRRMGVSMALSGFSTRIISGTACIIVFIIWKLKHSDKEVVRPNTVTVAVNDPVQKNEKNGTTGLQ